MDDGRFIESINKTHFLLLFLGNFSIIENGKSKKKKKKGLHYAYSISQKIYNLINLSFFCYFQQTSFFLSA